MKYLLTLLLLVSLGANAQLKSYILGEKGDTLNRVDAKGLKQGPWVIHQDELRGEPGYEEEGYYKNDRKEGIWRRYSLEGDLLAMEGFAYGMKNGRCQYFTHAGEPLREESWRAIDPNSPYDTVAVYDINDPTRVLRYQVVKVEPASYKHGTWTYYNTLSGTVEKTEEWVMNQLKEPTDNTAKSGSPDDDLAPIDPASGKTAKASDKDKKAASNKPQVILDYEKKNAGKKKVKVRDGNTGG